MIINGLWRQDPGDTRKVRDIALSEIVKEFADSLEQPLNTATVNELREILGFEQAERDCRARDAVIRTKRAHSGAGVYFVADQNNMVKIGHSSDVLVRVRKISTGASGVLTILHVVAEPDRAARIALENSLHQRFAELRITGEWFSRSGILAEYIKSACDGACGCVP